MKHSKFIAVLVFITAGLFSCDNHEVIPPPEPMVDLENHFEGVINGTDIEFTENVDGFEGSSDADYIISAGGLDSAVYYSTMTSTVNSQGISVGHGSISWDANSTSDPTLSIFNNFYASNLEPNFSLNGKSGFTFTYTDQSGTPWVSDEQHIYPDEYVLYSNTVQESDKTGDYAKFDVAFETYVYHTDDVTLEKDSLLVTDAFYTGWYKR